MIHFWIISLVLTKHHHGSIDIANVVRVHADVSEAEAIGKTVQHANECLPDYAIQITEMASGGQHAVNNVNIGQQFVTLSAYSKPE